MHTSIKISFSFVFFHLFLLTVSFHFNYDVSFLNAITFFRVVIQCFCSTFSNSLLVHYNYCYTLFIRYFSVFISNCLCYSINSQFCFSFLSCLLLQYVSRIWTSLTWLNLVIRWFGFRLEQIFATSKLPQKNDSCFISGQKWLENNHLDWHLVSLNPWHTL